MHACTYTYAYKHTCACARITCQSLKYFLIHPQMVTEPPRTLHSWKGHEGTVVSVEYINHDAGIFILSASVDKTAKLWTICGEYIGTFGQVNIHLIFLKFYSLV